MTLTEKPQEGEFHYLPGSGVVMAHYPKRDSKSLHAKEGKPAFVSMVPGTKPVPMNDENIAKLKPIPSEEEMDKALVEANKAPKSLFIPDGYFGKLLSSDDLLDVAKAGSYVNKDENNPDFQQAAIISFSILSGVHFYHQSIQNKNPEAAQKFITEKSKGSKHKTSYARSAGAVISRSAEILEQLAVVNQAPENVDRVAADQLSRKPAPAETAPTVEPKAQQQEEAAEKSTETAQRKEKSSPTDEQRALVETAVVFSKGNLGVITDSNIAADRLHTLFEVGKVEFQDTVILLRHAFARPQSSSEDTIDMLNQGNPEVQMDKPKLSATMGKLKKDIKRKFGKAALPEDKAIYQTTFDWRPEV